MPNTTTVTVGHIRQLLDSPAERPTLYVDHAGRLDVDPAAHVSADQVVLDREQIQDWFDGDLNEARAADAEDLEDLISGAQSRVEEITE